MEATREDPPVPGHAAPVRNVGEQVGGGRETARRAKTRERLMDAAYRLFSEHGINGTSIETIADEAGYTRGAFYSNFSSKTELFFALTEQENRTRLDLLRRRFGSVIGPLRRSEGKPSQDLIEEAIADILSWQTGTRQWCLMRSEFRLLAMRDPEVAQRFLANDRAFQRKLAEMVETAIRSVGLRFLIDSVHLTQLLLNQYESAMQESILAGVADPERATRETMMRTLPALLHSLTELVDTDQPE